MAENLTKLENLINTEVMADMIRAKVEAKIRVIPYAKVDNTLKGTAGDTVSIPKFAYIGDAVDVAEGEEIPTRQMAVTSDEYTIKMAGIGGEITDKALLCGHGNPVGELTAQIATSIASKCDNDAMEELYKATTTYTATKSLCYDEVVNACDLFNEEEDNDKVMFIHPKQKTQLRLDPDFISKEKYGGEVMVSGEIGMVAGCRVKVSKKVKLEGNYYLNPIVKLTEDAETEDSSPALTYFIKRETNVEKERYAKRRTTEITGDQMYAVALTNETKVVVMKAPKERTV